MMYILQIAFVSDYSNIQSYLSVWFTKHPHKEGNMPTPYLLTVAISHTYEASVLTSAPF